MAARPCSAGAIPTARILCSATQPPAGAAWWVALTPSDATQCGICSLDTLFIVWIKQFKTSNTQVFMHHACRRRAFRPMTSKRRAARRALLTSVAQFHLTPASAIRPMGPPATLTACVRSVGQLAVSAKCLLWWWCQIVKKHFKWLRARVTDPAQTLPLLRVRSAVLLRRCPPPLRCSWHVQRHVHLQGGVHGRGVPGAKQGSWLVRRGPYPNLQVPKGPTAALAELIE